MASLYQDRIKTIVRDLDPRHVEALMRSECGRDFDGLDPTQFSAEARKAAACVDEVGAEAEQIARSFGL